MGGYKMDMGKSEKGGPGSYSAKGANVKETRLPMGGKQANRGGKGKTSYGKKEY